MSLTPRHIVVHKKPDCILLGLFDSPGSTIYEHSYILLSEESFFSCPTSSFIFPRVMTITREVKDDVLGLTELCSTFDFTPTVTYVPFSRVTRIRSEQVLQVQIVKVDT